MAVNNTHDEKRNKILEDCFDCFCENGLENTSTKMLAKACGMSAGNLFNNYFDSKDEIIIECTAHGMAKTEEDFLAIAPQSLEEIEDYINKMPYITHDLHAKKYRFMYQVYASPRYLEYGKEFSKGVTERYSEYARQLAPNFGLPWETVRSFIYVFVRACVYYALFENEEYLQSQLDFLKTGIKLIIQEAQKSSEKQNS
ncbi:MAG: TetR/AcrR family transcriptional regulator [Erysipelotrichaceae bacterium]|nr:TetR/AcrR family transcriptional regulator [Erysipelotrichaceae bacterium]